MLNNYQRLYLSTTICWFMFFLTLITHISADIFEQSFFFYHTNNELPSHSEDLNIYCDTHISFMHASSSFDPQGHLAPLFGKFGTIDFELLANNAIGLDSTTNIYDKYKELKTFRENVQNQFSNENKAIYGAGELSAFEALISGKIFLGQQPIFFGIEIPIRSIECKQIKFCNHLNEQTNFTIFLNKDFDKVLKEQHFQPLSQGYDATGISDIILRLGWQGDYKPQNNKFVKYLWSNLSVGLSLPFSTMFQPSEIFFFHIPLGYGGSFGSVLRYEAGIELDYSLGIHIFGENKSFFKRHEQYKVMHHPDMKFFNFLKEYEIKEDRGSYWHAGFQIKSKFILDTVKVMMGYSYHSQEQSAFEINREACETEYLYDITQLNAFTSKVQAQTGYVDLINYAERKDRYQYPINDYLVNQCPKLQRMYAHIAHFSIVVEPNYTLEWCQQAKFILAYHKPFYGKGCFAGQGISSQANIGFRFNF